MQSMAPSSGALVGSAGLGVAVGSAGLGVAVAGLGVGVAEGPQAAKTMLATTNRVKVVNSKRFIVNSPPLFSLL
jgi:hypothetical protein